MKSHLFRLSIVSVCALVVSAAIARTAAAGTPEPLHFSCSAQIFSAIGEQALEEFEQDTGIDIATHVCASGAAISRLQHGLSDIAATTEGIFHHHRDYGYVETPFCKDPLAVLVHKDLTVQGLSASDLRGIFSGAVTNWQSVGGPDLSILLVVPSKNTAAFRNFDRQVQMRGDLKYDVMSYRSTRIIDVVSRFPEAVSFISHAATMGHPVVKSIPINGLTPTDPAYPFHQVFSFVTKGTPADLPARFIAYWRTGKGRELIMKKNMQPVE